jgi:hypothetical protein
VPDGTGITYRCETCFRLSDEHPKGTVKYCKGKAYNHDEYVRYIFLTWDKTKEGLCALYRRCKYRHMNKEEDEVTLVSVYRDQRGQLKIGERGRGGGEEERAATRGGGEEERAGASINQAFEFQKRFIVQGKDRILKMLKT